MRRRRRRRRQTFSPNEHENVHQCLGQSGWNGHGEHVYIHPKVTKETHFHAS